MKHIYTLLLLACISITACKKDNAPAKPQDDGKKYEVKFNATAFSQEFTDYKNNALKKGLRLNADIDTSAYAIRLNILDSIGNKVYSAKTSELDGNLGQFALALPAGTYKAVFTGMREYYWKAGRDGQDVIVDFFNDKNLYFINQVNTEFGIQNISREIFFKELTLNVPNGNPTQNVSLKRITSRLIVNIKDMIPASATRVYISVDSTFNEFSNTPEIYGRPSTNVNNISISNPAGTNNFTSTFNMLVPPNNAHTITIEVYNGTTLLAKKIITDVVCSPNQITLLRGNLFGGSSPGNTTGTQVKVDTTWNSTVINKSF